eukprot:GHVQ01040671.1.p1 GENE.GHVQ01040671.1~~GHVQ01040671.1.p1  ORF type:complete len:161 (+),score=21.88 GHVQ01040671.1:135-617(+)
MVVGLLSSKAVEGGCAAVGNCLLVCETCVSAMAVATVCFVGRQNEPLSMRVYGGEDELAMQFATYASLDVIDEKASYQQRTTGAYSADAYLGYICPALCLPDDYRVYAYLGSTGIKIVVTIQDKDTYQEGDIRGVCHCVCEFVWILILYITFCVHNHMPV